ncbi:MAG: hypothetical protein ACFFDN_17605 [Candidatus Hodarchaeota archaeon]
MEALVINPGHGSVWLSNCKINEKFIEGETWDNSQIGSSLLPDNYMGEKIVMNFPISCIKKIIE